MPTNDLPDRLNLSHRPTPLTELGSASEVLGVRLRVKRDDLTGSHLSGNKIRKLDFILADALAKEATTVITCGGLHSNHCRATALAAASLGLQAVLLLRTRNGHTGDLPSPLHGNLLLDHIAGARFVTCTPEAYRDQRAEIMRALADSLASAGERPYVIPEGGSNALGALGYVDAAEELLDQLDSPPAAVVVATGSGGTLAGLALGMEARAVPTRVVGVAVCDDAAYFEAIVERIAAEARERFGLPRLSPDRYLVLEGYQGRGYGLSTPEELAFLAATLKRDGLLLDPVYTNKAYIGLARSIDTICPRETSGPSPEVIFIHTGGIFGLSAFAEEI